MAKIKGAAVREFLLWYAQRYTPDELRAAIASLPPSLQVLFDDEGEAAGILVSSWYDSAAVGALIDAVFARIPETEHEAAVREGASVAVTASARGIYRFVLERLSPELYCRNIQRLWGMLHDTGRRDIVTLGPGHVRSTTREWDGHHPVLCMAATETMRAVFEVMGCRETSVARLACVGRRAHAGPDDACVWEVRWRR